MYDKVSARREVVARLPKFFTQYDDPVWVEKQKLQEVEYRPITPRKELRDILGKKVEKFYYSSGRDRMREIVRIRDNRQCQMCGDFWNERRRRFDVHHLNGLCGKKSRQMDYIDEIDGMITLCHRCHFNHPEHSRNLKKQHEKLSPAPPCKHILYPI